MSETLNLKLKVWRQSGPDAQGFFETYDVPNISTHMSFLEMLDILNSRLEAEGKEPIVFEHDCREGICGSCGFMINGQPHGHKPRTTTCQLHMREFAYMDGGTIVLEPFAAKPFKVLKDLMVDRSAFDRIIQAGGYVSVRTGSAPDAHSTAVNKSNADKAFDAAACIGCGACVASCPNAAAMLFTGAKVTHLALLPQGQTERYDRVQEMVFQMDSEDFGHCSNYAECTLACPKGIPLDVISQMNQDMIFAQVKGSK
ncbi:MAG: succinate dehydrogenase/fumarate reductase iron-sulfur subunit [Myxococcota bacterium]|nr:succinate dehydrogenase/fumarate reductase iron-sulfur subunit [Myxococcota bacterium]